MSVWLTCDITTPLCRDLHDSGEYIWGKNVLKIRLQEQQVCFEAYKSSHLVILQYW